MTADHGQGKHLGADSLQEREQDQNASGQQAERQPEPDGIRSSPDQAQPDSQSL